MLSLFDAERYFDVDARAFARLCRYRAHYGPAVELSWLYDQCGRIAYAADSILAAGIKIDNVRGAWKAFFVIVDIELEVVKLPLEAQDRSALLGMLKDAKDLLELAIECA
mgnify:CR=1 FL=1